MLRAFGPTTQECRRSKPVATVLLEWEQGDRALGRGGSPGELECQGRWRRLWLLGARLVPHLMGLSLGGVWSAHSPQAGRGQ